MHRFVEAGWWKRFALLALSLALAGAAALGRARGTIEGSLEPRPSVPGNSLRVVLDDAYPPYCFRGPDGALKGILVDQWALWEKKTGIPVRLEGMDWSNAQRRMERGEYDVIDMLFENERRRALYELGPAYARIDVPLFFSRELSGISGPRDLTGFVVGAKAGDNAVEILKSQGVDHVLLFKNYEDVIAAASKGRIKVFAVDAPPALHYLMKRGILDTFRKSEPLYTGDFHRGVTKGRVGLMRTVQRGFDSIARQEYAAIDRKWMGAPLLTSATLHRIAFLSGLFLAILGALLVWVMTLKRQVAQRTAELRSISTNFVDGMFFQLRIEPSGQHRFTFLSESVSKLYGVTVAEAMADHRLIQRRIHPDDLAGLLVYEDLAKRELAPTRHEVRIIGPDGEARWSSIAVHPRKLRDGSILLDGVEFIITDRKHSEEALKDREAQYRSLLSAIPDLVLSLDHHGNHLAVHADSEDMLVLPPDRLVGLNIDQVLPPSVAEDYRQALHAAIVTRFVQELSYTLSLNGEPRQFEARLVPTTCDQILVLVRDITQAHRLREEQQQLQAQLQQAQKMESLGVLAGGIAHDMNNVLGAILVSASTNLERQKPDSPEHRAFSTIAKAATRGGEMVKSLLRFARKTPVQGQQMDVNEAVRDVVRLLERTTLAKVHLELDLDPRLHAIHGDAGALSNTLMNLAVNSVDAMPNGGTLTLRTRNLTGSFVEIQVADDGEGMPPDVLSKAMDPFFTTKAAGKGTGLGLSMAFATVEAHKGRMDIQSEPGKGTRVTLRLPAASDARSTESRAEPGVQASCTSLRLLVVDDDDAMRGAILDTLSMLGHHPESCASGEEALARVRNGFRPEVILLDINMPGLGGLGTLPELCRLLPTVPVVLITGKPDPATLEQVDGYPNVALLPKPFSQAELREGLDRAVEKCLTWNALAEGHP